MKWKEHRRSNGGEEIFPLSLLNLLIFFAVFITSAVYYGQVGFEWKRFFIMEIWLYLFIGWAIYKVNKTFKR